MKRALLLICTLLLASCSQDSTTTKHKPVKKQTKTRTTPSSPAPQSPARYRQELKVVRKGKYRKQRLLNKPEEIVYHELLKYCKRKKLTLFSQVSLGEVLKADGEHYRYINAKRIDFCITDSNFLPVAAVEYQGTGHKNSTSDERDAIKRTALESAGVFYIPVNVGEEKKVKTILDRYF